MNAPAPPTDERKVVVVAGAAPELRILQWPLRDEPAATAVVLGIAAAASVGIGLAAASTAWGAAAALALFASLWRMWTPVEIRLCQLGVIQTALRRAWRIPWSSLGGYELRRHGVVLIPADDDSMVARLRGLYVRFGGRKEELLAVVNHYLQIEAPHDGEGVETLRSGANDE